MVDIAKVYSSGATSVTALKRVNIGFTKGEFVAILGPSGSGKTTLLYIIAGVIRPTKGMLLLNGRNIADLSDDEWAVLRRKQFGFVFQSHNLIGPFTAYENVELPLIFSGVGRNRRKNDVAEAMRLTETWQLRARKSEDLSGGEQQRVAITRAIVTHPQILLADEPTGDLDTETSKRIIVIFKEISLKLGTTVLVTTHDPTVVKRSDRMLHLRDGWISSEAFVESG